MWEGEFKLKRNPKKDGTIYYDCKPQVGKCPMGCSECFYNRENAFYIPINYPIIPDPDDIGEKAIVQMNSGHDSNIQKELVLEVSKLYKRKYFSTSIPNFDFPGPVVFTANRYEEEPAFLPNQLKNWDDTKNIMAVRLRTSSTNLNLIDEAVKAWTKASVPVLLTFMAYYSHEPEHKENYIWRVRHTNSYWCPTKEFKIQVAEREKMIGGDLVFTCGTPDSDYCKDCNNCAKLYRRITKDE